MIVILGAGLAGLATAWYLGDEPHVLLEAEDRPGGLCRTRVIDGFHFDYTGHLLHLRDPRVIALLEDWLPGAFEVIERKAFIRTRGTTLPFPFQGNLHGLPKAVVADCVLGFIDSMGREVPSDPATSFRDWSLAVFGTGISDAFMFPYNAKLFRRDPAAMTADWVSWSVPRPNLREVVCGALGVENRGMGYNPTFRYPSRGGIEVLPDAFARRIGSLRLGSRVATIDLDRREVRTADGRAFPFDRVVSTIPLPGLLRMMRGGPEDLTGLADALDWSVVACLNLGLDREAVGGGAHWIYFPDPEVPFYRVGFPSNVTSGVAPHGRSSLYVEFGLKRDERLDTAALEAAALPALRREGIIGPGDRILVKDWITIDPGYVVFDRERQQALARALPALERCGIRSIGRYGAWTYSYMERAILDGLETAAALRGGPA